MNRAKLASAWPPTRAVAIQAGHKPMSPVQAIRRKCLDCSGQQLTEVKLCETVTCPLWPFRAGRHPYTARSLLEADFDQGPSTGTPAPPDCSSSGIGLQEAPGGNGGGIEGGLTTPASQEAS